MSYRHPNRRVLMAGQGIKGFDATSLPGLRFWHDASQSGGITLNATDVATVADLSGQGRAASQSTGANQPLYNSGGLNGLNSIQFNGTNQDALTITNALSLVQNVNAVWFGIVIRRASLAATNQVLTLFGGAGAVRVGVQTIATSGAVRIQSRRLDTDSVINSSSSGSNMVTAGVASFIFGYVAFAAGQVGIQVDGNALQTYTPAWASGTGNSDTTASSGAPLIGRSGATVLDGDIGEDWCGTGALPGSALIAQWRASVVQKWGTVP